MSQGKEAIKCQECLKELAATHIAKKRKFCNRICYIRYYRKHNLGFHRKLKSTYKG